MTDRARRRWVATLVPALLLATACAAPVTGTPVADPGADTGDSEQTSTVEEPDEDPDGDESTTSEPGEPDEPDGGGDLGALVGTWEGAYTCAQGETGAKLAIEAVDESTLKMTFEFFPLPENPDAKSGSYVLLGAYSGSRLVFTQEEWIEQPPNYVMVDLEVTSELAEGMTELNGTMLTESCGALAVTRTG
ncbi:hypothetical protein [Actinophytocola xinjiangensis]|uniref:hypothetical protein n=1 Tax=Actinophytocola xinjiangensis TaxID=485602 RepID=UPI000A6B9F06|nr:hypothetical protein [Actinophytocola xinjiangensis]